MTIEVVDQPPHVCTPKEECDPHRAQRFLAKLKADGYPDEELEAFYLLLLSQARLAAVGANTIILYQNALSALVRRHGGRISISEEETEVSDGTILNPDVNMKTGEVTFTLTTMEKEVADARARVTKTEALAEARELDKQEAWALGETWGKCPS